MAEKRTVGRPKKQSQPEKAPADTNSPVKHPGGRPTKYKPEYCLAVEYMARTGMTEAQIAERLDVHIDTITEWKKVYPEFSASLKLGKEEPDDRIEASLYARATGYSFDSEKIMTVSDGKDCGSHIERVPIVEHCPPDVTAQIFWLKNRRPGRWRDRMEHTGADGGPISIIATLQDERI